MKISEEKEYIYSMMKSITEERRRLTDIYYELKKNIDDLNLLEQRGLTDLNIKGFVELNNSKSAETAIRNIQRESNHVIEKIEKSLEVIEEPVIPKQEIEKEKDKLPKVKGQLSLDKVAGVIASTLKEYGRPMSVVDLHEVVNEKLDGRVKLQNFRNNILPRTTKQNSNVRTAMRGYYQYMN